MKKLLFILVAVVLTQKLMAQDTFSIVAVDSTTGEIGSAGASCISNSIIISNIVKGRGAVHTQSYYLALNQNNARKRMIEGMSPDSIMLWSVANDAQNTPKLRQYGAVDFGPGGSPRSAAFTGANCLDWKGHRTGPNYAIQGNILIGPQVIDSMEARFLAAKNLPLADRLMAAMQGANIPGADFRCIDDSISSLSAFLILAKPNDPDGQPSLKLNVKFSTKEPIDSLQKLFDAWKLTSASEPPNADDNASKMIRVYPNPSEEVFFFEAERDDLTLLVIEPSGRVLYRKKVKKGPNQLDRSAIKGAGLVIFRFVAPPLETVWSEKIVLRG